MVVLQAEKLQAFSGQVCGFVVNVIASKVSKFSIYFNLFIGSMSKFLLVMIPKPANSYVFTSVLSTFHSVILMVAILWSSKTVGWILTFVIGPPLST